MDKIGYGDYFDQDYFNIMISGVIDQSNPNGDITERKLAEIINSLISSKKTSSVVKNSIAQAKKQAVASVV